MTRHDSAGVKAASHSAVGASRYVGAMALGESLSRLEELAESGAWEDCQEQLGEVMHEMDRVHLYLKPSLEAQNRT